MREENQAGDRITLYSEKIGHPVSLEREMGNLRCKVTELQSADKPINECYNVNPCGHIARAGKELVITTADNLHSIITSKRTFLFHSKSVMKGRITAHTGNFPHVRRGGTLFFFQ